MGQVSRTVTEARLAKIAREIDAIEDEVPATLDQYMAEDAETLRYALQHRLFLVLQAVLDMVAHIAAVRGKGVPASYADAIQALGREGIVAPELAARVARQAGLRNIMVHDYLELDDARVYAALTDLGDIKAFSAAVWEWVQGE